MNSEPRQDTRYTVVFFFFFCTGKGVFGTNRVRRAFGSTEKFINITQGKRSEEASIGFVFVA